MTVLVHSGRRLRGTGTVNHGSFGSKISLPNGPWCVPRAGR